jgi:hypothetical protein
MRIRLFTSIAICAVALGLTGCRVQSVLVMPPHTPVPYAAPGQILEWLPSSPKAATIWVVFDGVSPCEKQYYPIGPEPARCKVLKDHAGNFTYHFEKRKPDQTKLFARSCPYCQVAIGPGSSSSAGSSNAGESNESKDAGNSNATAGYTLFVSCQSGVAAVDNTLVQNGVQDQDEISWAPIYPSTTVTVTTPNNMCSGGQGGVFTAQDVCTVTGKPGTSYPYSVQLDKCDRKGSSTLSINQPPPTQ